MEEEEGDGDDENILMQLHKKVHLKILHTSQVALLICSNISTLNRPIGLIKYHGY
jgi:hypothetical protein